MTTTTAEVIPAQAPAPASAQAVQVAKKRQSLIEKMAQKYSVDPQKMLATLKATAFRVKDGEVSNEQMMALLVVADQYNLNPWTKEIYAFPDKNNGVVPVVGVDGWSRIINSHPEFDGMEFRQSDEEVKIDDDAKPAPEWMECLMYRKDRSRPIIIREYLDEVYRPAFEGKYGKVVGPWQTHTKRFLRHKTMIQAARVAFGFVGIYDEDEASRIIEGQATVVTTNDDAPAVKSAAEIMASLKPAAAEAPATAEETPTEEPAKATATRKGKKAKEPEAQPENDEWLDAYERTEVERLGDEQAEDLGE